MFDESQSHLHLIGFCGDLFLEYNRFLRVILASDDFLKGLGLSTQIANTEVGRQQAVWVDEAVAIKIGQVAVSELVL